MQCFAEHLDVFDRIFIRLVLIYNVDEQRQFALLQCVAVCCSVLQCVVRRERQLALLQGVAVCCNVLECVAVCCRVLQGVAGCCSVLQSVAVW